MQALPNTFLRCTDAGERELAAQVAREGPGKGGSGWHRPRNDRQENRIKKRDLINGLG